MKTFMAKKEAVERKWYVVDAAGKPLGRVATVVASILRGKNKPTFTPHVDTGDFVIVLNCDKVILTGKKLDQKLYVRRSPRPGHLKEMKYRKLLAERSDFAMMKAVKGMLPHNSLGRKMLTKLRVYKGAEHRHEAQQPEVLVLD
ncbi:MAG: 50S ribosomal protein L13 [Clostridia bacterium]|nr:50S ribosomal protein L13 [Clostridia bacterium]MBQ9707270.1 50S ribosomal protein L13 [Clostridia bacterium]MBR7177311.1 50S ribosomal protein L13 [Clostridia bacterium]